jgi:hypothetical protein
VTSVAKQPDPAAQSNGFENVDWEMHLCVYQNDGMRHLASASLTEAIDSKHFR